MTSILKGRLNGNTEWQYRTALIESAAGATQPVTSHVLDTALGRPAEGVLVTLQKAALGSPGPGTAGLHSL